MTARDPAVAARREDVYRLLAAHGPVTLSGLYELLPAVRTVEWRCPLMWRATVGEDTGSCWVGPRGTVAHQHASITRDVPAIWEPTLRNDVATLEKAGRVRRVGRSGSGAWLWMVVPPEDLGMPAAERAAAVDELERMWLA